MFSSGYIFRIFKDKPSLIEPEEIDSGISVDENRDTDITDLLVGELDDSIETKMSSITNPLNSSPAINKSKRRSKTKLKYRMEYSENGEIIKIYQCQLCEKEFKYQSGISSHITKVHTST